MQISDLQIGGKGAAVSEKDLYAWQNERQPGDKDSKGFSLMSLIIAAIISLYIGYSMTRVASVATHAI